MKKTLNTKRITLTTFPITYVQILVYREILQEFGSKIKHFYYLFQIDYELFTFLRV